MNSLSEIASLISTNKNIDTKEVLFSSTGVIGEKFPIIKIKYSLENLLTKLDQPNRYRWVVARTFYYDNRYNCQNVMFNF